MSKEGAKLIVYGIAGSHDDVPSDVFDAPFVFEGRKMVMETDLDLNGHKILKSNLKNNFMLIGRFRSSESGTSILFDNYFNDIILPIRCKIIKAFSQILTKTSSFPQLTLILPGKKATQSGTNFRGYNRIQTFSFPNVVYQEGELFSARIKNQSGNIGAGQITFLFEITE